jgi:hypothetical protein
MQFWCIVQYVHAFNVELNLLSFWWEYGVVVMNWITEIYIIWIFSTGKWLPEEEKRLCDAVYELTGAKQGRWRYRYGE